MTDAVVPYTGWGRGGWSGLEFGAGSLTPTPSLVASPGSVTLFVEENVFVSLAGLQGAANFGGIMVEPDMNVFPGGVFGSAFGGQLQDVTGDSNTLLAGFEAALGEPSASLRIVVGFDVAGLQAISQLSGVMVEPDMNVFPVGLAASGGVSAADVSGDANTLAAGVEGTAPPTTVDVAISLRFDVFGSQALISTAGVLVWGAIDPDQESNFSEITPTQTSSFFEIAPDQGLSFSGITPTQQPDWVEITPETA